MNPKGFFGELKRRNVIRMAGLYVVGAWLVVQVAGTVLPMFGTPEWLPRTIVVLLAIGFVPAVIFSWVFELTPEGLKRDEDVASGTRSATIRASRKSSPRSRRKNEKAQPTCSGKRSDARHKMKYWEIIADNFKKAGTKRFQRRVALRLIVQSC